MTHEECESAEALALRLTEHEQVMSKQRGVIDELASKLKALADMVNENTERLQILQVTVESIAGELNRLEEGK